MATATPKLTNIALLRPLCLNNEAGGFTLPADGMFQLVPLGNAPNAMEETAGGKKQTVKVLQICDEASLQALCNHAAHLGQDKIAAGLPPELATDFRHQETDASGWVDLTTGQVRADGLYFKVKLTNEGASAVTGGTLRYFSPNFSLSGLATVKNERGVRHVRPTKFDEQWMGALTNNHNFRQLKPLSNEVQSAETTTNPETEPMLPWQKKFVDHLVSIKLLNSADATAEQIEAASATYLANATAAETALTALRNEQLTADLEKYQAVIPADQKDFVTGMLRNDRANALKFLDAQTKQLPAKAEPTPQTRLTNGQHKPNGLEGKIVNDATAQQQRMAEQSKLVNEIQRSRNVSYDTAFGLAQSEKPELFAQE